jgi:hypothetical protein
MIFGCPAGKRPENYMNDFEQFGEIPSEKMRQIYYLGEGANLSR